MIGNAKSRKLVFYFMFLNISKDDGPQIGCKARDAVNLVKFNICKMFGIFIGLGLSRLDGKIVL